MANKETRIYKTDTLEKLRQKSNEISLHLGDNEQLNVLMADKTYIYSAASGQTLFAGPDTSSPAKTSRFETSPAHTIDNTAGYIILETVSSIDASYVQDAVIYQGTNGSPTWQAYIVSATADKILVRDSSGTFTTTADLKVGASSPDTIVASKIIRIVVESYPVAIARVYNGGTELTQGMGPNSFHSVNIKATITQTGSPTLTNYTEGVTVYQGASQTTQSGVESTATWYGTLHSVSGGVIRVKTYNGSFSASTAIRALGSSNTITGTNHGALVPVDSTYGSYVQLTTPAASSNQIKVFSLDVVAAINELQDDIGTVESLTTAANDLVLAINEHDAELGTITAGAMGTTASTVSTAIREHEDQIGNIDITDIASGEDTITGALEQLHDEVGDVTASNLGTSASNLTSAVREHEDQIGNENITSIDSGSDTITGALNQLHTEVGDLALHTTSTDLTEAINELEEDLFNGEGGTKRTRASLLTTDKTSIVDSINELHSELFVDGTGVSFTGLSADFFKEAVEELRTELGNHAVLDTNVTTDAVSAINELENVLRDDTTQRTGYVMGTNANNIIAAINEIETVLRGSNSNYTLNTSAQNVRDALNEHEQQIGNMLFGTGGPVDAANSDNLSAAVRVLDAEIGDTSYTGADLTTAIKNTQDDILIAGSLTTLNTTNKFIQGAINEIEADLFNAGNAGSGGSRREMADLKTADKTSIVDSINEIYDDIHTAGSVTLDTNANYLVGAINEIEGVFDASTHEISAGTNAFDITSGTFTIDSSGDIILDADGADVFLKDAGTTYGSLTNSGNNNIVIKSGTTTMLTGSGADATFNNDVTVENNLDVDGTLNADGATTLNATRIDGNLDLNGSVDISTNAVIHGTTELNSSLGVDGDFRVGGSTQANGLFTVNEQSGNTVVKGTLEVDGTSGVDGNFRVGSSNFNTAKFKIYATTGNTDIMGSLSVDSGFTVGDNKFNVGMTGSTQIDSWLEVDGTAGIDGNFRVGTAGNNYFNVTASNGNTQIDGTLEVDGSAGVDGNLRVGANKFNVSAASGNTQIDGTLNVDLTATIDGITTITNTTESSVSSATDGALIVAGGASIGKNLYVGGNLQVEGTQTVLNTETLTVEDTLVLAGNNLVSEPSTGGFGLEIGPITSPSGVASNVTGAHSIVYNYGHDNGDGTYGQWQADGSLILSTATLATPQIEGVDFGPNDNLTFSAGSGLSETSVKTGSTIVTNYINTDKGSSQFIFKTVAPSSGTSATADVNSDTLNLTQGTGITTVGSGDNIITITNTDRGSVAATALRMFKTFTIDGTAGNNVVADSNADTLNLRGLDSITLTSAPGSDTINIDHDDHGTAGTYGITGTQDGQYIKSIITNAQGHVTGVTSADFDTRYQATNPSFEIKVNDVKVDDVFPGDKIDLIEGVGIDIAGSLVGTESNITISHQDTSSVGNLSQNNSGNTFIQDLALTFDTFGHVTGATASTGTVSIGNGATTVTAGGGITLGGDVNWSANQSAASTFSVAHADTSSQASVNNSGRTYIQDITLDTYGHITAISSATESYVYTPPEYDGDDINIDTGALSGATVISDLDFNIETNILGHVTDANATIATRNLTLADLGWNGWDLYTEGTKRADINVNGIVNLADDGFLTTTYSSTNNTVSYGHPTTGTGLNGTYGGNNNGIVIEDITVDTRGHVTTIGTVDLDGRYDNYYDWNLTADSGGTASITSNTTVDIAGGNAIDTVRSGDSVIVNFVNPGYISSQRTATLDVQGNGTNPYVRLNDGTSDHVQVVGGTNVTVTGSESLDRITISSVDTNTDINVNDANLRARLAGLNPAQGVAYIGDGGNDLDLRIRGNLTITGTTTSVNTTNLNIADNFMVVNSDYPNQAPTEDAGIEVERGSYTNAFLKWNESSNRWQQTIGNTSMTYYNMSIAPDNADQTSFSVRDDSNSVATITRNEVLAIDGGTAIGTNFITAASGESHRLEITHSNVSHTDSVSAGQTLAASGTFSAVTGVDVNAQGHVIEVITKPFTLPASAVPNNATITIAAGTDLITGGAFTTDQSFNETITVNHSNITRSNTTSTDTPNAHNATFTAIDSVTTNARGHVTGVNTKTVRFPASDNTNDYGLTTFQVEDGDGTEVTISHGKEWKFLEGNDINVNWTDTTPGSDADPFDLQFSHKDTTRTNTTTTSAPGYGGTFTAISAVTSNARGHVTGVQTKTVTIPASDNTDERYTFDCVQNTSSNNNPYLKIDGSTESPQYVLMNGGTNVTVTRTNDAALTISATDNDTTYSQSFVDNGANVIHRLTAGGSGSGSDDLQYVPGGIVTLTPSADNMTISAPGTNLATAYSTSGVTITSSTGTNAAITEASGTQAGVMTVAQHNKLDGIEAGATGEQVTFSNIQAQHNGTNTVLHSADAHSDTFTIDAGDGITIANGTDKITIDLATDQRFASTTDNVYVGNGHEFIHFDEDAGIKFYTTNILEMYLTNAGSLHVDQDIIAYSSSTSSDIKLKENVKVVDGALEKISQLNGVTFDWKNGKGSSAGVIAQNVETVLPSAVKDVETMNGEDDETHKVVDYNQLSALFIEAIKELKEENKLLRAEIENLKDINN